VDGREPDSRGRIPGQRLNQDLGFVSTQAGKVGELRPDNTLLLLTSDDPEPLRGYGLAEP